MFLGWDRDSDHLPRWSDRGSEHLRHWWKRWKLTIVQQVVMRRGVEDIPQNLKVFSLFFSPLLMAHRILSEKELGTTWGGLCLCSACLGALGFWVLCGLTVGVKLFLLQREVTVLTMFLHPHGVSRCSMWVNYVLTDILFAPIWIIGVGAWGIKLK
jgi:hypothetical protein